MNSYTIHLTWENAKPDQFTYDHFSRDHQIEFSGDQSLLNSASPDYLGSSKASNPEELLAAALASCHMLTFLAIASKTGVSVGRYSCKAVARLNKKENGKMAVTEIDLYPVIEFYGEKRPDREQITKMHDQAHRNCFIAQSIESKVNVHIE